MLGEKLIPSTQTDDLTSPRSLNICSEGYAWERYAPCRVDDIHIARSSYSGREAGSAAATPFRSYIQHESI